MKRIAIAAAIVFAVAGNAAAKNLYIPAAGSAPGANNTRFRTDVRIFNPSSTETISISVHSCGASLIRNTHAPSSTRSAVGNDWIRVRRSR